MATNKPEFPTIVGAMTLQDVADRAGLSLETVRVYHKQNKANFPEPKTILGRTPVWEVATIDEWIKGKRGPGRPAMWFVVHADDEPGAYLVLQQLAIDRPDLITSWAIGGHGPSGHTDQGHEYVIHVAPGVTHSSVAQLIYAAGVESGVEFRPSSSWTD